MCLSMKSFGESNTCSSDEHILQLAFVDRDSPQRALTEAFVRTVFERAYGAKVSHFLPRMMTLSDGRGELRAALGLRRADHAPLFLETYLDEAVETLVARIAQRQVTRAGIVEVGNLASTQRGALRCLITALTAYLKGAGAEWAVFTATPTVLNAFRKLGITLHTLGPADKARLGVAGELWGSYYETSPMVVAGNVAQACEALESYLALERAVNLAGALWKLAYAAGMRNRRAALPACINLSRVPPEDFAP